MSHARRFLLMIKKRKWLSATAVIVLLLIVFALTRGAKGKVFESVEVVRGNVIEKVSITGTVMPVSKADLAFKKSGVISKVAVKVGDRIKKGDLIASIDSTADFASLGSAQAQLNELQRGLRPEEYNLYKSNLDTASIALANAKKDAVNTVFDAYVKAQSSVVNYADNFFNNAQSINPRINVHVQNSVDEDAINTNRVLISDTFLKWKADNDAAISKAPENPSEFVSKAGGYITKIKVFMSSLSAIITKLNTSNSGLSQSVIDTDVGLMNTGFSVLTQAITSLNTADNALKNTLSAYNQANGQFNLQLAGSSQDLINSQAAKVLSAQSSLNDSSIISPIDGVVTKADPNVGEFVNAGLSGFAVQNENGYKIEAFVPEADIAKITLKDSAKVTLDAYGQYVFFPASVVFVDPAETILQGVPTYKVTLYFDQSDARIRSGMTANTDIMTHEVNNVLVVPSRAVMDDNGNKSVRVVNADNKSFTVVPVLAGLKGSDGTTEIISGVSVGQKVVTYVK